MKHIKTCPHCGAKSVEYPHSLAGIVKPLVKLADAGGAASISGLLTHNECCNFHKVKYWQLAEPMHDGYWRITERGRAFLAGRVALPKTAWSWRGEFSRYDGKLLLITDIMPSYKRREDYAASAQSRFTDGTLSLFEGV